MFKTIAVSIENKTELDKIKLVPQESYDNIIGRLIKKHKSKNRFIEEKDCIPLEQGSVHYIPQIIRTPVQEPKKEVINNPETH